MWGYAAFLLAAAVVGTALLHAGKGVAHQNGFQPTAHSLHFRQFRHGVPA